MGAGQSRARPGPPRKGLEVGGLGAGAGTGYFILSFKEEKIKVVNIESAQLKLLAVIIKRHCKVVREGWDRHMTFSFKLEKPGKEEMIQLVADSLLSLFREGWEPMTPIDTDRQRGGPGQTSICFRRWEEGGGRSARAGSSLSLASQASQASQPANNCLCIETSRPDIISFHGVPNTVLHGLVSRLQADWGPGLRGVSMGVASVISDYTENMPPTLGQNLVSQTHKTVQLNGSPWSRDSDLDRQLENTEQINHSIIGVLANSGYRLSLPITMPGDRGTMVYFFIHDPEHTRAEVRAPTVARAGMGEKGGLSTYQPVVTKSRQSFYKTVTSGGASVRRAVRASLRRRALTREGSRAPPAQPAWWQQSSIDMSETS